MMLVDFTRAANDMPVSINPAQVIKVSPDAKGAFIVYYGGQVLVKEPYHTVKYKINRELIDLQPKRKRGRW